MGTVLYLLTESSTPWPFPDQYPFPVDNFMIQLRDGSGSEKKVRRCDISTEAPAEKLDELEIALRVSSLPATTAASTQTGAPEVYSASPAGLRGGFLASDLTPIKTNDDALLREMAGDRAMLYQPGMFVGGSRVSSKPRSPRNPQNT